MREWARLIGVCVLLGVRCGLIGAAVTGLACCLVFGLMPVLYGLLLCVPMGAGYGLLNGIVIVSLLAHFGRGAEPSRVDGRRILLVTTVTTASLSAAIALTAPDGFWFVRAVAVAGLPAALVSSIWATNRVLDWLTGLHYPS
jgi:hypothetical protein